MIEYVWWSWAILLPTSAIFTWLWLVRLTYQSDSKKRLLLSASLPPALMTYSLLSWYVGFVGYCLPGPQGRQQDILFNLLAGTFWRRPLDWLFEVLHIFGPSAPWTADPGSTPYLNCFANPESLKYFAMGIINETSVVCLLSVGLAYIGGRFLESKRAGT